MTAKKKKPHQAVANGIEFNQQVVRRHNLDNTYYWTQENKGEQEIHIRFPLSLGSSHF